VSACHNVHLTDLRSEPCVLRRGQWTPHTRRDPARMRGVVLHQWDAEVGTEGRLRFRYGGEAEALGQRAAFAAYTISAGVGLLTGVPVVSLAHPVERYTFASDSACGEWIAVGVMGLFPFKEAGRKPHHTTVTDAWQAAVDRALAEAVKMLPDDGGPWSLITHRQGINGRGDHVRCPGEAVVAMALRSPSVRDGLLVPDPDLVIVPEWGKTWPASWRAHLASKPSAARVASEHHALPFSPVGDDGNDATQRA
jgi:hypothetical protein